MIARFVTLLSFLALPAFAEVPVKEITSPGGIRAWVVEAPEIPFVALEIRFRGGATLDPVGKEGVTTLMAGLLEEGTGDLDAQGFAAARDDLAARYGFGGSKEEVSVSARFLTENRDASVELLRRALNEPSFPAEAIERVRGQIIQGLIADQQSPDAKASEAFRKLTFGDHTYGRPSDGTLETIPTLTAEDIKAAYKAALARDRVSVAAVGDITADELGPLIDKLLMGLPATGAPLAGPAKVNLAGQVEVVDFPGPQSVILFGQEGISLKDPDYVTAFVISEILGGGRFGTRLMTEVREKRGLTYGISAGLSEYDQASLIIGQVQTGNATAAETIKVIRDEWARISQIDEAELASIKTYLTGAYPLRWDGNANIASALVSLQMMGYPVDYPAKRNSLVEAVTLVDAKRVAARLYDPKKLSFVVVGTPVGLEQE